MFWWADFETAAPDLATRGLELIGLLTMTRWSRDGGLERRMRPAPLLDEPRGY